MTIMQRPDKIPAGPTDGRFFAVCAIGGFDVQSYPNFQHLVIRFLLLKVNRWYGSMFELQCKFEDNQIILNYFDIFFMNYFYKKLLLNVDRLINVIQTIATPWHALDRYCASIVSSNIWTQINAMFPAAYKRKKYNIHKNSI